MYDITKNGVQPVQLTVKSNDREFTNCTCPLIASLLTEDEDWSTVHIGVPSS